ncbi:MAG: AMP-binding protein, partial [Gammaproteobacteria bacterium]|nr:AMP-binding protein [Gammaproteobacteria bacterium]
MPTVATAHIDSFARDHLPPREQWPEFRFELPELAYPERLNCARVLLDEAVDEGHGERSALHAASGTWSYNQVLETSCRIAHVLVEDLGLVPGNRVLLRGANTPWLVACWFAVIRAGGIAVTTMPMLRAGELAVIAEKAQISHALCDARLAEELEQAAGDTPWLQRRLLFGDSAFEKRLDSKPTQFPCIDTHQEDVALLAFTSGTTGVPKATMHFHRDVLAMSDTFARYILRTSPDDIYLGSPPLGFTFGLGALLVFPFRFRAASVLVEAPSPDKLLAAIEQFGVTALFTAPTAYRSLLGEIDERHLRTLKTCVSAGEPLPRATSDAWHDRTGIRIIDGIGTTEMIHIFLSCAGEEIRPGSTGKPVPGYEVCVLDERNRPLPPGNSGRLAVKGPTGCRYLGDKRQRDYVIDGWNVTADRYRVDEDGYFWFIARA